MLMGTRKEDIIDGKDKFLYTLFPVGPHTLSLGVSLSLQFQWCQVFISLMKRTGDGR